MKQMKSQLQQKNVAFSVGGRQHEEFSHKPQAWEKKFDNEISQLDKEPRSVVHEMCEEFCRMLHKQLLEFAMMPTKKYYYN